VIALDTCVLARLLVGDDPQQQRAAVQLVESSNCSVGWSVLVELCWVLESSHELSRDKVVAALSTLRAIDRLTVPHEKNFDWCVERYAEGADFADMVHLVAALGASFEFATFDRKLLRQAGTSTPLPVVLLNPAPSAP
jgi:predicted nucleic-acid-binding protein